MRICIKNGILLDGGQEEKADLYLKDGVIEGRNLGGEVDETYDAQGNIVTPALIDLVTVQLLVWLILVHLLMTLM